MMKGYLLILAGLLIGASISLPPAIWFGNLGRAPLGSTLAFAQDDSDAQNQADQAQQQDEDQDQQEGNQQQQQEEQQQEQQQNNEYQQNQEDQRHQEEQDRIKSEQQNPDN